MSDPETDHPSQSDVPLDVRIDTIEEQLRNGDDPLRIQKQHIEDFSTIDTYRYFIRDCCPDQRWDGTSVTTRPITWWG